MASLRDTVKDYQDELRDGIAWVAFWKQGRSWNAEYFHLDMDDTLYPEDRSRLEEIKSIDPAAVTLNGYYCGHLGEDMSLDELTAGVRYHYENSMNDIDGFIGAHDDRLPPEVIEEARAAAHEAGLPFSEKPYRDGEDFNPYVFDGSMSIEDFELMHRMIEKERSEQMAEPILSGYLSNLGKYTEGRPAGEWVTFPTTAEHLKEVFDRIGIDFKHYEEWHFTEFQSTIPGLTEHLSEYSHPDELNYLGKLLEMQFDDDREKFIAAIEYGDHADSLQDIINLAQNLDCYWIYPSVHNEEEYGRYLVDELEEPELPEEAKKYFMYEEYGRDASINDDGMFTEKGYIYNNRNTFTEWYDGRDVPEEYRVTPQPPQPERPDPSKVEMDAAAPGQRTAQTAEQPQEPRPVIPIVLTSEKPAEKLKEITDRLEQGIAELFDSERYREYLKVMSKFHNYSFRNTVLIAMQKPDASLVAGFSAWKNNFERNVMKGQKGIKIIAPSPYKIKQEMQKIDPHTQKPVIGKDGKPVTEEKEVTIPAYKVVSVFDVSQTEGKELPDIAVDELTGDVDRYKDFFAALEKTSPVPIAFENIEGGSHGLLRIVLAPTLIRLKQRLGAGFTVGLEADIALGLQELDHIVAAALDRFHIFSGLAGNAELIVVPNQSMQTLQTPEKDTLFLPQQLVHQKRIIRSACWPVFGGQYDLAAKETVGLIVQGRQRAVAKAEKSNIELALVALHALTLHVHLALGGHDGFDIIGLGQGAQIHIIVHHQEFVLQVRTAEPVALHLLDAGGIHAVAQQGAHDKTDTAFALAALTDEHEHLLSLGSRQQAVTQKLLQGGNVLRLQQL